MLRALPRVGRPTAMSPPKSGTAPRIVPSLPRVGRLLRSVFPGVGRPPCSVTSLQWDAPLYREPFLEWQDSLLCALLASPVGHNCPSGWQGGH
jgi:hypothetical protein